MFRIGNGCKMMGGIGSGGGGASSLGGRISPAKNVTNCGTNMRNRWTKSKAKESNF